MIAKPKMYDELNIIEQYEKIELGGHKGIIKKVEEYKSAISGNTSLKVEVDTDTTDKQPSYFEEQYKNDTRQDKKWSNSAIKYVSLKEDENCVRMLKAFITSVENSNNGFTYNWDKDVEQLNGKKVGLIFGLEEYTASDGKVKTIAKLNQFRSIDKVDNAKIPRVRKLDGTYVDYEEYTNSKNDDPFAGIDTIIENASDDVPFEI